MADDKETDPEDIQVKLNFRVPPRMPSVYAHHMFIQPAEHEVVLSFFEIIPPPHNAGLDASERLKYLQDTGINAECVARITIAIGRFPDFANAMQEIAKQVVAMQAEDAK